jgi:hypothetical protein
MTIPSFSRCFDLQAHMPRLRVSMQYLSSNVRPKFSTEIADEIEPEVEGTLQRAEADGIYAVRIPFVGEEGSSVVAAQTPGGQCLAAAVGARENSAAKCVSRSAQKACIVRAKISRVLVQRRIQAERQSSMDRGTAKGGRQTLTVGAASPAPTLAES